MVLGTWARGNTKTGAGRKQECKSEETKHKEREREFGYVRLKMEKNKWKKMTERRIEEQSGKVNK